MPEFQIQVHNLERTVIMLYIFAITEDNWFGDCGRLSGSYNCNNTSMLCQAQIIYYNIEKCSIYTTQTIYTCPNKIYERTNDKSPITKTKNNWLLFCQLSVIRDATFFIPYKMLYSLLTVIKYENATVFRFFTLQKYLKLDFNFQFGLLEAILLKLEKNSKVFIFYITSSAHLVYICCEEFLFAMY